jgi:hypothetical protein
MRSSRCVGRTDESSRDTYGMSRMSAPRKYYAPCDIHAVFTRACKHCTAWAARMRRTGGPQIPRAKRLGTTGKRYTFKRHVCRGVKKNRWPLLTLHGVIPAPS